MKWHIFLYLTFVSIFWYDFPLELHENNILDVSFVQGRRLVLGINVVM